MVNKPIFHLSLTLSACMARVSLNGFLLAAVEAKTPISVAPPSLATKPANASSASGEKRGGSSNRLATHSDM